MSDSADVPHILDACSAFRMMWLDKNHAGVVFLDQRDDEELRTDKNLYEAMRKRKARNKWQPIVPTTKGDFRKLDFPDASFDLIFWDPPHLKHLSSKSLFKYQFGMLQAETWQSDLKRGAAELWRVLQPGGVLIFKWSDHDIPWRDVLKLFPDMPLVGQRTAGGANNVDFHTYWFTFKKPKAKGAPIFTYLQQPLNRYTFKAPKTRAWVEQQCQGKHVLNLFAGPTRLQGCIEVANDIDPAIPNTLFQMDALECAKMFRETGELFDVVLIDGPYSYRKSMELYHGHKNSRFKQLCDVLPDILTPHGIVITFGYHSRVMGEKRGFRVKEICVISHGGAQRDTLAAVAEKMDKLDGDTIATVEERVTVTGSYEK